MPPVGFEPTISAGERQHNKSIGCSASGAYALGPDDEEEEEG